MKSITEADCKHKKEYEKFRSTKLGPIRQSIRTRSYAATSRYIWKFQKQMFGNIFSRSS